MDLPRYIADYLKHRFNFPAEAEPSPANIADPHFIVRVENFWQTPEGTSVETHTGPYAYTENGPTIETYRQAIDIRVIWRAQLTGEKWRGIYIEQARENAIQLTRQFLIPAFGGKLVGKAAGMADDGQGQDIADFENNNAQGPGLGFIVLLDRDPASDVVFKRQVTTSTRLGQTTEKDFGFLAEQHFKGQVTFNGGAEVPKDERRSF